MTIEFILVCDSLNWKFSFFQLWISDTKYWQEKAAAVARKFVGKGLHFVMCDEGKQSADMASMKLTDLGVVSYLSLLRLMPQLPLVLMSNSLYKNYIEYGFDFRSRLHLY